MNTALVIYDEPGDWTTVFVDRQCVFSHHNVGNFWPELIFKHEIGALKRVYWDGKLPDVLLPYAGISIFDDPDPDEDTYLFGLDENSQLPQDVFDALLEIGE